MRHRLARMAWTAAASACTLAAGSVFALPARAEVPVADLGIAAGTRINKKVTIAPTLAEGLNPASIVLYANNTPVAFDFAAPWSLVWDTTSITAPIIDSDVP